MADAEQDRKLEALGGFVERTSRRVDHLEQVSETLTQDVARLAADLDAERPVVRSWLLAEDPAQARSDLADLVEWLAQVYLRYPRAALPSCWLWHPAVVEELWWLRQAHYDAYESPHASYARAADWHDRQRPHVVERITKTLGGCELSLHEQGTQPPVVPLTDAADRIAEAWTSTRSAPRPTPEELTEAEHHDHRTQRTSHP